MYLAPSYLSEVDATAPQSGFIAYGVTYPDASGKRAARLAFHHTTLKAAFRSLGSMADHRGKLYRPDLAAAFIMSADGETLSWNETKALLAKA